MDSSRVVLWWVLALQDGTHAFYIKHLVKLDSAMWRWSKPGRSGNHVWGDECFLDFTTCCFRISISRVSAPSLCTRNRRVLSTCLKSFVNVLFISDTPSWSYRFRQLWAVLLKCLGIKCFLDFTTHSFRISMSHDSAPSLTIRIGRAPPTCFKICTNIWFISDTPP